MKEKCIIIAVGSHWDSGNSVSLEFKELADQLVKRNYKVIILVPGQETNKVIDSGNLRVFTWPSKRPTKVADAFFLYKILRHNTPTAIIGNFAAVNWILSVGWLLSVEHRIAWYHTLMEPINIDVTQNTVINFILNFRKKYVYKLATRIVAVSDYAKNIDLISKYHIPAEKVMVFHNFLKLSESAPPMFNAKQVLVCVGRLDFSKGHDILLNAMPQVIEHFPNVSLRIIGDGSRRKELEQMTKNLGIEKNIIFLGKLAPEEVLNEFAQSYACVHPARIDNCPLVLIEAISVGLPVIATRTGGIPEIIQHEYNGLLFPREDSSQLGESICMLLGDRELREKYSLNSKKVFLSGFELESGGIKIVDWLEELIEKKVENKNGY